MFFWDPMASTAMRPESGDLGVFDKTWTCSVIQISHAASFFFAFIAHVGIHRTIFGVHCTVS